MTQNAHSHDKQVLETIHIGSLRTAISGLVLERPQTDGGPQCLLDSLNPVHTTEHAPHHSLDNNQISPNRVGLSIEHVLRQATRHSGAALSGASTPSAENSASLVMRRVATCPYQWRSVSRARTPTRWRASVTRSQQLQRRRSPPCNTSSGNAEQQVARRSAPASLRGLHTPLPRRFPVLAPAVGDALSGRVPAFRHLSAAFPSAGARRRRVLLTTQRSTCRRGSAPLRLSPECDGRRAMLG